MTRQVGRRARKSARKALWLGTCLALAGCGLAGAASAQTPTPSAAAAPKAFDAEARRAVVETAAKTLIDNYIFPDTADQAAALIRGNLTAGKYDALGKGVLAERLTTDLRSVTHDKHIRVSVDEESAPDASAAPPPKRPASLFLFERADRLKGNIGYTKLNGFLPTELFKIGADDVMAHLANCDALIIDMRDNHGGNPGAVSYLVSFFVAAGAPVHVNDIVWREAATHNYRRDVFSTSQTPTTFRNKPVYLLTGPGTFSGGEEFSYDMQQLKLGRLVGEVTGGGANPGWTWPLGEGLTIFVPTGRAENPLTKTNWEGTGVQPDVPVAAAQAFGVAYDAALSATNSATRQKGPKAASPDEVVEDNVLTRRTTPYSNGAALVRRQVDGLIAGQQATDTFSPGLAEELKGPVPADLQAMMVAMGAVQSVTFTGVDEMGGDTYDVEFAKGGQVWNIVVDGNGKVASVNFGPK